MNNVKKSRRLFFAIWPDENTRQAIIDTCSALTPPAKGRLVTPANLHVTLHFVGQVTEEVKHCMHQAALTVDVAAFALKLDRIGDFRRSKILWMGTSAASAELTVLYQKLGLAIAECGYQFETRPYAAHVTLMRKCVKPVPAPADFSIPWQVNSFVLVESIAAAHGVTYQVIEKYPLSETKSR